MDIFFWLSVPLIFSCLSASAPVCLSAVRVCSFVSLLVCFVVVYFIQFLLILLIDARKEFVIATIILKLNFSFDNIIFFSFFLSVCLCA